MKHGKINKAILFTPTSSTSRQRLYRIIRSLDPGVYAVDLTKQRGRASNQQRGYYWGYLIPEVAKYLGRDREEVDKILRALLLSETWEVSGQSVAVTLTTSDLNTVQTEEYYSRIRAYAWNTWRVELFEPNRVNW